LTEPETGSDAQNIKTTARLSDDGTKWILDGHKIWIGNAHRAGVIATFAQTDVERRGETVMRSTAFIIRPDMPGFRILGTVRKLGIRGSTQAELLYEGLEVPSDHVLGAVGKGFTVAVQVLNAGRLTLAAGCASGAKVITGEMARYAEQRVQFGHPLAHFEITQRKLSHLAASAYAADSMLGILASLADIVVYSGPGGRRQDLEPAARAGAASRREGFQRRHLPAGRTKLLHDPSAPRRQGPGLLGRQNAERRYADHLQSSEDSRCSRWISWPVYGKSVGWWAGALVESMIWFQIYAPLLVSVLFTRSA